MNIIFSDAKFNYSGGYLQWDNLIYLYDSDTLKPKISVNKGKTKIFENCSYFLNTENGTIKILDWRVSKKQDNYIILFTKHNSKLLFCNGQFLTNGQNKQIFPSVSSGGGVSDHQELENLQGGILTERYHLTKTQHDNLTDGENASLLHIHDDRYYTESESNNRFSQLGHTHTHNDTTSKQGGTTGQYYHLTQSQHNTLTDGSDASLLHIHNAEAITFSPLSDSDSPGIVTADQVQNAILQLENYLYNVFGISSNNIGISYTGLEYDSLGIYDPA